MAWQERRTELVPPLTDVLSWTGLGRLCKDCISAGCDDYTLSLVVRADAASRTRARQSFTLGHYLEALPDLPDRVAVIDAAVECCLRSAAADAQPSEEAAELLCRQYPSLTLAIRRSMDLTETAGTSDAHQQSALMSDAPTELGPVLLHGARRYELNRLLGRGANADVFLAQDRLLSRPGRTLHVAVKVPRWDEGEVGNADILREAHRVGRISHPHVLRVLDVCYDVRDCPCIVYEYVAGGTLSEQCEDLRRTRGVRHVVRLVEQCARGVEAVHAAGLLHCDIKPANVLLSRAGIPKLGDFGVAVSRPHPDSPFSSDASAPLGSLGFMAPEQFRQVPLGAAADVYALGGLLAWAVTGFIPNGATWIEVVARLILNRASSSLRIGDAMAKAHPWLVQIWQKAIHPDPEQRYRSADEFADDVSLWLGRFERRY